MEEPGEHDAQWKMQTPEAIQCVTPLLWTVQTGTSGDGQQQGLRPQDGAGLLVREPLRVLTGAELGSAGG